MAYYDSPPSFAAHSEHLFVLLRSTKAHTPEAPAASTSSLTADTSFEKVFADSN